MTDDVYRYFLMDLTRILRESSVESKISRDAALDKDDRTFLSGRLMAYNEVISLIQQQAAAFEISLDELALNDLDPDRDLT